MEFRIVIDKAIKRSFTDQVADLLRTRIVTGKFIPGERLPSVRKLASQARISLFPVAMAFQQLQREGLLTLNHGGGARVSTNLANPSQIVRIMLTYPGAPLLVDAFRRKHPEYIVIVQPYSGKAYEQAVRNLSVSNSLDLISFGSEDFSYLAGKNALLPLDEETLQIGDATMLGNIQETFRFRQQLLGAAFAVLPFLLLARRSMLDRCNAPFPSENWTGNDLLQLIRRLTQDANGDGVPEQYGYLITSRGFTWYYLYHALGGEIASWRAVASEASRAAVNKIWDAIFKQRISPINLDLPADIYGNMIVNAARTTKVGLMLADLNALRQCKRLFQNDLAPLRSPRRADGRRASLAVVHGVGIPRTAVCREGALAFIRFLQTPEAQRILCKPVNLLPVNLEAWDDVLGDEKDISRFLLDELQEARPMHHTDTPEEMLEIEPALYQLVSGFLSPDALLAKMDSRHCLNEASTNSSHVWDG